MLSIIRQRVLPGQALPPGLWVKMDMQTGDTYAKFLGGPEVPDPTAKTPPDDAGSAMKAMAGKAMLWLQRLFQNDSAPRAASFSLPPHGTSGKYPE